MLKYAINSGIVSLFRHFYLPLSNPNQQLLFIFKITFTMSVLNFHPQMLLGMPNAGELVITLLIVVIFFGGKKIPELARGLGKGIREFNEAKDGIKSEIENGMKEKEKVQAPGTPSNNA
jgi:sec-independent protein translocase protein TatA